MQNFCLTVLTLSSDFYALEFFVLRDLDFALIYNFQQLNSNGGRSLLEVK